MPQGTHLTIEIKGDEDAVERFDRIRESLKGARLEEAYERVGERVGVKVRQNAPRDLGHLVESIIDEVLRLGDEDLAAIIYSDLIYAAAQERGTEPFRPPVEELEGWAERHDADPWIVADIIASRGLLPRRYFQEGLMATRGEIYNLIGEAVAETVEGEGDQWQYP